MTVREEALGLRISIKKLRNTGMKYKEIGRILNVSHPTISKWVNRPNVADLHRPGRTPKINTDAARIIKASALNKWTDQGASTRSIAKKLKRSGINVTHVAVHLWIKKQDWGKKLYKNKTKPLLTELNIKDRQTFCDEMRLKGYLPSYQGRIKSRKILFTDEKIFPLFHKPNSKNHRIRTLNPELIKPQKMPAFNSFVYCAGGIHYKGKSKLVFHPGGRLNTKKYIQLILPKYVEECKKYKLLLQQDGLKAHYSAKSRKYLSHNKVELLTSHWPGNSPDLVRFYFNYIIRIP
jgi:transposase